MNTHTTMMNQLGGGTPKKKPPVYTNDNILEALRGVGSSVGSAVVKDVVVKGTGDVLASIFGGPLSGDLKPNQSIEFPMKQAKEMPIVMPKIERQATPCTKDDMETKQKIEALRKELKALSETVKALNQDIRKTILEAPVETGVYHINFYDQLRIYIQALRLQIEDSRTWLAAMSGKKKKQGYWGMSKKHGTSWSMSNERSLATSSG